MEWEIGPEACENGEQGALACFQLEPAFRGPVRWGRREGLLFRYFVVTNAGRGGGGRLGRLGTRRVCVRALWVSRRRTDSYLVDPASSHMLVSKIKPCMSKYKQICTVKLRMAH